VPDFNAKSNTVGSGGASPPPGPPPPPLFYLWDLFFLEKRRARAKHQKGKTQKIPPPEEASKTPKVGLRCPKRDVLDLIGVPKGHQKQSRGFFFHFFWNKKFHFFSILGSFWAPKKIKTSQILRKKHS
jgi:hypothetical protein